MTGHYWVPVKSSNRNWFSAPVLVSIYTCTHVGISISYQNLTIENEKARPDGKITDSDPKSRHRPPFAAAESEPCLLHGQTPLRWRARAGIPQRRRGRRWWFHRCREQGDGGAGLEPRHRGGPRVDPVSRGPDPPWLHRSATSGQALQQRWDNETGKA